MKKAATITATLLIVGMFALIVAWVVGELWSPGSRIGKKIVELSDGGSKPVDLAHFAERVCFVPEGPGARSYARDLFLNHEISYVESNDSDGSWFFVSAVPHKKEIRINAISQSILRWDVPGTARKVDFVTCPKTVTVSIRPGQVPELQSIDGKAQGRSK